MIRRANYLEQVNREASTVCLNAKVISKLLYACKGIFRRANYFMIVKEYLIEQNGACSCASFRLHCDVPGSDQVDGLLNVTAHNARTPGHPEQMCAKLTVVR